MQQRSYADKIGVPGRRRREKGFFLWLRGGGKHGVKHNKSAKSKKVASLQKNLLFP